MKKITLTLAMIFAIVLTISILTAASSQSSSQIQKCIKNAYTKKDSCNKAALTSYYQCTSGTFRNLTGTTFWAFLQKCQINVLRPAQKICSDNYNSDVAICKNPMQCNNLYWYDDTNKTCSQKQFCGAYMYQGLHTFSKQSDCLKAVLALNQTAE